MNSKILEKLTVEQYGRIRFAKEFIFQKKKTVDMSDKKRIWFLDAPAYGNLGDQAIAYGIHSFCKSILPNIEIVEFQEESVIQYLSWLKKTVKTEDIIVLQGGGNLGNLYPRYEFIRRVIVRSFPKNRIIIFPQSIYFSADKMGRLEKNASRKAYSANKNLVLFARDSKSYKTMKKAFPDTYIEICPDIVFFLNGLVSSDIRKGIGICMRDDKEKTVSSEQIEKIIRQIKTNNTEKKCFDTVVEVDFPVINAIREHMLLDKLKEFAECEIIITDRLHGMIFSYITSTPCIAIANSTGKSLYAYNDWLSESSNVFFVQNCNDDIVVPRRMKSQNLDFSCLRKVLLSEVGEEKR